MAAGLILLACTGSPTPGLVVDPGGPYVAEVDQEVALGGDSRGGTFTWRLGDGTTLQGDVVEHAYGEPGNYRASLTGTTSDGRTETQLVSVTVVHPPLDEPPRASSAMLEQGGSLYVVMPDFDRVAVVDRATGQVQHLDTCSQPRSLSHDGRRLAVACLEGDAVDVFEGGERTRIELPVGSRPFGVVWAGEQLAVTTWLGLWLDGEFVNETRDLRGLAWSDGALIWSRHRSPDEGGQVWVGDDLHTLEPDPGPDTDTDARGLPSYLQRIAVRPDGRTAVLPGLKANIERGSIRDGQPLTFETTTRGELRQIALHPDEDPPEPEFDNRDLAVAAAWSPLGDVLYVGHVGARIIDVLDGFTMQRIGGLQQLGNGLDGLWADDTSVWASLRFDRTLVEVDVETMQVIRTIDLAEGLQEPLDPQVLAGQKVFYGAFDRRMSGDSYMSCASCHLDGDHDGRTWDFTSRGEGLRNTKALWAMAGQGPLHWSANFDEVQDFERDIRESMGGAGFLSEDDHLETLDPWGPAAAGRSEDLDALAAYVASLADRVPVSPFSTTAEGQAAWDAGACGDCHLGERLTDSQGDPWLYDVGTLTDASGQRLGETLTGIDTPSLLGVFYTAPYLHDGSAETLHERFEVDGDGLHGAPLTPQEIDALVEHLRSL